MIVIAACMAAGIRNPGLEILESGRPYTASELSITDLLACGGARVDTRRAAVAFLAGAEGYIIDDDGCTHWIPESVS